MNVTSRETPSCAVFGLVLSILAIVFAVIVIGLVAAIPAVICAHIALSRILKSNGTLGGKGMAITGLVLGYTAIVVGLLAVTAGVFLLKAAGPSFRAHREMVDQYEKLRNCTPEQVGSLVLEELSAGRQEMAESMLDFSCQQYPTDQKLLFAKAACARSRFSLTLSTPLMERVRQMDPKSVEGQCARYVVSLDSIRDFDQNMAKLVALAEANPDNPYLWWMLGVESRHHFVRTDSMAYAHKGADSYARLLKLWKTAPVLVHQTYANILSEELGEHEKALVHRRLAVQLEPEGWSYQGLGNTLVKLKRYDEANVAFAKCTELDPTDSKYWQNWANCLFLQKKYEEAIRKCQISLQYDSGNKRSLEIWADCLVARGRLDEEFALFERYITQLSRNVETRSMIGNVRWRITNEESQKKNKSALPLDRQRTVVKVVDKAGMLLKEDLARKSSEVIRTFTTNDVHKIEVRVRNSPMPFFTTTNDLFIAEMCQVLTTLQFTTNEVLGASSRGSGLALVMNNGKKYQLLVDCGTGGSSITGRVAVTVVSFEDHGSIAGGSVESGLRDWFTKYVPANR